MSGDKVVVGIILLVCIYFVCCFQSPLNLKPRTSSGSRSGSKDDGEFGQTVREIRELGERRVYYYYLLPDRSDKRNYCFLSVLASVAPHLDSLQRKQIDDVTKKAMGAVSSQC